jgi:hypothetical protein
MGYVVVMAIEPAPPEYRAELARSAASAPVRDWIIRFICATFVLTVAAGVVGKMRRGNAPPPTPAAPAGPLKGAPAGS